MLELTIPAIRSVAFEKKQQLLIAEVKVIAIGNHSHIFLHRQADVEMTGLSHRYNTILIKHLSPMQGTDAKAVRLYLSTLPVRLQYNVSSA